MAEAVDKDEGGWLARLRALRFLPHGGCGGARVSS